MAYRQGLGNLNAKNRRSKKRTIVRTHLPFCYYCGNALEYSMITLDHVVPWSKGGSNRNENLVPACYDCNQSKGGRVLGEADKLGKLPRPLAIS